MGLRHFIPVRKTAVALSTSLVISLSAFVVPATRAAESSSNTDNLSSLDFAFNQSVLPAHDGGVIYRQSKGRSIGRSRGRTIGRSSGRSGKRGSSRGRGSRTTVRGSFRAFFPVLGSGYIGLDGSSLFIDSPADDDLNPRGLRLRLGTQIDQVFDLELHLGGGSDSQTTAADKFSATYIGAFLKGCLLYTSPSPRD